MKLSAWAIVLMLSLMACSSNRNPHFTYSPAGTATGLSEEGKKFFTRAAEVKLKGFDMAEVTFVDALIEANDKVLAEFTVADSGCRMTVYTYDGQIGLDVPFEEGLNLDKFGSIGILWFDGPSDSRLKARPEVKNCRFNS